MLEIRYVIATGKITRGAYSPKLAGGHFEPTDGEEIAVLDMFIPEGLAVKYLYDSAVGTLIPDPDYVEPPLLRDLLAEVTELEARIIELEAKRIL